MSTINISLPPHQANLIDSLIIKYGFSNRSEFFRSIIRYILLKPDALINAAAYPFIPPKEKSVKKMLGEFSKTKKYSKAFLKDLNEGLSTSDYFKN